MGLFIHTCTIRGERTLILMRLCCVAGDFASDFPSSSKSHCFIICLFYWHVPLFGILQLTYPKCILEVDGSLTLVTNCPIKKFAGL